MMKTYEEFKEEVFQRAQGYAQGIEEGECDYGGVRTTVNCITGSDPENHLEIYIVEISSQSRKPGYKKSWPATYRRAFLYDTQAQCFIKATVTGKKKICWKKSRSQPETPITLNNCKFHTGTHGIVGLHKAPPSGYNCSGYQSVGKAFDRPVVASAEASSNDAPSPFVSRTIVTYNRHVQFMLESGVTRERAEELDGNDKTTCGAFLKQMGIRDGFTLDLQEQAYWSGLQALMGPTVTTATEVQVSAMEEYEKLLLKEANAGKDLIDRSALPAA
ncbi:MAG TPA: hypothetical protein EYP19_09370 [Desulfobacterales bacterium]|nr:hypothetical protein [Desulfobacterales bacterium]